MRMSQCLELDQHVLMNYGKQTKWLSLTAKVVFGLYDVPHYDITTSPTRHAGIESTTYQSINVDTLYCLMCQR